MKKPPSKPHFFKPVCPGFKHGLDIPAHFLKYLKKHDQYKHVILRKADKKWQVKLNGGRLEDGWGSFVEEHNLQLDDMLVFRHEGDMEFEVMLFDSMNQCEKEYKAEQERTQNFETSEKFECKEAATHESLGRPHFVCTIRPYCLTYGYLRLPAKFVSDNNLMDKKYDLIIRDERQRSWNIRLVSFGPKRVFLDVGWPEFRVANDLKEGDEVMFEIVTDGEKPIWQFHSKPNHNIKSSALAKPPKPKFKGLPQRQNFEDQTLEVVTHEPFDKSNHLESSSPAEPPKSKSGRLPRRQNFEDRMLEIVTHKPSDKLNLNIKSFSLAEPPISKSREFSQRQDFEDQTLEVVTHKSFDKPDHNIKLSGETSPLTEVVAHRSDVHSHFACTVRPYCFVSDTLLIPNEFARANGLFNIKRRNLIVRDERHRSWNVVLRAYSTCVLLKDGWNNICDANCLKEGDYIMFEVVTDGEKPVWQLHRKISEEDASKLSHVMEKKK